MRVTGEALGKVVCHERQRLGLSQEELAQRAGMRRETVTSIEGGTLPTLDTLQKVADALGVATSLLMAHAERAGIE